ncbi:MAG: hypothetical protein AABY10_00470 [Nanoarchaeota archaeon]
MEQKNKKAAIELSIGTVVIIVLAMSMLILGLVLVRNIFSGSIENVKEIDSGVKNKIKELFQDEREKSVIYLSGRTVEVKQGAEYGVAFGIRNTKEGEVESTKFTYETSLADSDAEIKKACGVNKVTAESWVKFGTGDITVKPGPEIGFPPVPILVKVPDGSPLCTTRFKIIIKDTKTNDIYDTLGFILRITA